MFRGGGWGVALAFFATHKELLWWRYIIHHCGRSHSKLLKMTSFNCVATIKKNFSCPISFVILVHAITYLIVLNTFANSLFHICPVWRLMKDLVTTEAAIQLWSALAENDRTGNLDHTKQTKGEKISQETEHINDSPTAPKASATPVEMGEWNLYGGVLLAVHGILSVWTLIQWSILYINLRNCNLLPAITTKIKKKKYLVPKIRIFFLKSSQIKESLCHTNHEQITLLVCTVKRGVSQIRLCE